MGGIIKDCDRPGWRPVKRNCWMCGWGDGRGRCDVIRDKRPGWIEAHGWWCSVTPFATPMPHGADGCPGWKPKPEQAPDECGCWACSSDQRRGSTMVLCAKCGNKRCPHGTNHNNPCSGRNTPGQAGSRYSDFALWDYATPKPEQANTDRAQPAVIHEHDIPGHRPNVNREQMAALADSATTRPHSATATVESLLRRAGVGGVPEAVAIPAWGGAGEWEIRRRIEAQWAAMGATRATAKESMTVAEDPRPICRGPGGIRARRMRRAGLAVRGGR